MLGWRNCNPYLFRYSEFASHISTHRQTIVWVPNSIHSWLNLAPQTPFLCLAGNRNAFLVVLRGVEGYPATEYLIGQFPIKANAQKYKLQSSWQTGISPRVVCQKKKNKKTPTEILHMANDNANIAISTSGMVNLNGKYYNICWMRSIRIDGICHDHFGHWRLEFLWLGISHLWRFWLSPRDKLKLSTLPFVVLGSKGISQGVHLGPIH